jgi:hypothetical protein
MGLVVRRRARDVPQSEAAEAGLASPRPRTELDNRFGDRQSLLTILAMHGLISRSGATCTLHRRRDTAFDPARCSRAARSGPWQASALVVHCVIAFLATACFHPSYDHPACSADRQCPSGLVCSLERTCEPASSIGPLPDAAVDDAPPALCGALTCDPNATCTTASTSTCTCKAGFTGDGIACADVDECATSNGGCAGACMNAPGSHVCYAPTSCVDIKSHVPGATDGTYMLYLGADAGKPWPAYCARMASSPAEYLTLSGTNFSQYTAGGRSPGTNVRTTYTRVRFDPVTMRVDISDRTFATSTGMLEHENTTPVTSMPYSTAMDCVGPNSKTGVAQIDLSGTSFALDVTVPFIFGGGSPNGSLSGPSDRQLTIAGGGSCGWAGPVNIPTNPFNDNVTSANGLLLQLTYKP